PRTLSADGETIFTWAPACSSAFFGSVNSTCSNPSATRIATFLPSSWRSTLHLLMRKFPWPGSAEPAKVSGKACANGEPRRGHKGEEAPALGRAAGDGHRRIRLSARGAGGKEGGFLQATIDRRRLR